MLMKTRWHKIHLRRISNFTLIELVLVMAFVSVGFIGVTSITSLGIDVGRDTIATGITTDAGEQFLRYNAAIIKDDWTWLDIFPDARPTHDDSVLSDATLWGWSNNTFLENDSIKIKFVTQDRDADFDPSSTEHNTGFFLMEQQAHGYERFKVSLRSWKKVKTLNSGAEAAILYVEASYPAQKPYSSRDKRVFSVEVFNASEIALASTPTSTPPISLVP